MKMIFNYNSFRIATICWAHHMLDMFQVFGTESSVNRGRSLKQVWSSLRLEPGLHSHCVWPLCTLPSVTFMGCTYWVLTSINRVNGFLVKETLLWYSFPSSHSRTYKLKMHTNVMLVLPANELQRVKNIFFLIEKKKAPNRKTGPCFVRKMAKKKVKILHNPIYQR